MVLNLRQPDAARARHVFRLSSIVQAVLVIKSIARVSVPDLIASMLEAQGRRGYVRNWVRSVDNATVVTHREESHHVISELSITSSGRSESHE